MLTLPLCKRASDARKVPEMFCRPDYSRTLASAVLLATLFAAAVPALASKDSVPDWVKAAAALPQPTYTPRTNAVVLLDDIVLTVASDGHAVERHRHVVKILRPKGRDEGIVRVFFDNDTKILALHIWSIGPDGHEYETKDKDIAEVGVGNSGSLYSDERFKAAAPAGRDPGGIIAYEYEQRKRPYEHEATWFFQSDIPFLSQSFTIELPPGYIYTSVWAHHPESPVIDLEHQRYRWEMPNTPAIDLEEVPMAPSRYALAGRMTVHYGPANGGDTQLGTWRGVGEWFDGMAHERMQANPEIAAKANALAQGKTDFYDKTEAIAEFVQKRIRYFVIEKGIGGWQPHPAADIFKNGYGDCKDKATLLSAMLSSVGVKSIIVLVDTDRGFVDPASPSVLGDHAIAGIEIPADYNSVKLRSVVTAKSGKRYLIVDPTAEHTAYGQLEDFLQGGYGVLVDGKESEIIQLPVLSPDLNTIRRTGTFHLLADGSIHGAVIEKRFGDLSESSRYVTQGDAKEQSLFMNRKLARDFKSFTVSDLKVENAEALNQDLSTTFNLTADHYGRMMGPLLMVRSRVLGSEGLSINRKPRLAPVNLRQTMTIHDEFAIEIPAGFTVDEIPAPVKIDLGFASYESRNSMAGNVLHYTRTYTVRSVTLPAEKYADLQKLSELIETDEQNHAVFKKN